MLKLTRPVRQTIIMLRLCFDFERRLKFLVLSCLRIIFGFERSHKRLAFLNHYLAGLGLKRLFAEFIS